MKRVLVMAVACAGLAACSSEEPASPPASAAPQMVTVQLGASGYGRGAVVRYTCMQAEKVTGCGPEELGASWTKKVTVPVGTTVRVQASPGALRASTCFIADESEKLTLAHSETGDCSVEAGK